MVHQGLSRGPNAKSLYLLRLSIALTHVLLQPVDTQACHNYLIISPIDTPVFISALHINNVPTREL